MTVQIRDVWGGAFSSKDVNPRAGISAGCGRYEKDPRGTKSKTYSHLCPAAPRQVPRLTSWEVP